jgi:2-polyprenyl-3-methyl-5-hydroxy-6-metoxy-1,4-benzoquinol methylase
LLKKTLKRLLHIPEYASLRKEGPAALAKRLLQVPADALIASSTNLATEAQIQKYFPYPAQRAPKNQKVLGIPQSRQAFYILRNRSAGRDKKVSLAVPPQWLRPGYGDTEESWLSRGRADVDNMMKLLNSSEFFIHTGYRVLDLGCASGRLIRWLADIAETCEIWGVDINAHQIAWCHENLSPPFNFATSTTLPHLPFEDKYFDLIYCGSVFTHIDDLTEAWLLEIKRIIKPGGRAYITVRDKHTADLILNHQEHVLTETLKLRKEIMIC